ncbi:MAG: hypothetical protein V4634_04915 [Pseudomonadota bacterium]
MQELNLVEVEQVSGASVGGVIRDIMFWGGLIGDGISYVSSLNQGGSPNGTDAMGNVY